MGILFASGDDPFHHIRDARFLELPDFLGGKTAEFPSLLGLPLTKFMILQVVAGVLTLFIFTGLARHIRNGRPARGKFWNFWEAIALYIRDSVVRPAIGTGHHGHDDHGEHGHGDDSHGHAGAHHAPVVVDSSHPADKYLPFIWTCFFYILFCNLLGAIPWLGSPTGNISVTAALAVIAFGATVISGSRELGAVEFWKRIVPTMELPWWVAIFLMPLMFAIEFFGLFIKHTVLAIRLFANIMAGHTVLGVTLGFIATVFKHAPTFYWVVTPASVLGQVGVGLLELLVAFLQAYVFSFLASLFIGTAVHPH